MHNINRIEFDRGWVLGQLVGDGDFSVERKYAPYVRFWGEFAKELADRAYAIMSSWIDMNNTTRKDGPVYNSSNDTYGVSAVALQPIVESYLYSDKTIKPELEEESDSFILGFLRGCFDSDGSPQGRTAKGRSIRLSSTNASNLFSVQRMLARFGIYSRIYLNRSCKGYRSMPDGNGSYKEYLCNATHELVISKSSYERFVEFVGFYHPDKERRAREAVVSGSFYTDRNYARVVSVIPDGVEDVYDCCVDTVHCFDANGIIVHNCAEILLPDKGICNLCEINVAAFDDLQEMLDAAWLIARANYRQTLVDLRDEVLQRSWHENNEFLRLCGVSLTGIVMRPDLTPHDFRMLRNAAISGANSMARELGTQPPRNVTTVKPSGTVAKVLDVTSGIHRPLGRFMFMNVVFSRHDPLVDVLKKANYEIIDHPTEMDSVVIKFPFEYRGVEFDVVDGMEVNMESALSQLERYRDMMRYWCDQNVSITVYYSENEVRDIINWLDRNWDDYVCVSFLPRINPMTRPEDVNYPYLPQQVVTESEYRDYVSRLRDVSDEEIAGAVDSEIDVEDCPGGICPVR